MGFHHASRPLRIAAAFSFRIRYPFSVLVSTIATRRLRVADGPRRAASAARSGALPARCSMPTARRRACLRAGCRTRAPRCRSRGAPCGRRYRSWLVRRRQIPPGRYGRGRPTRAPAARRRREAITGGVGRHGRGGTGTAQASAMPWRLRARPAHRHGASGRIVVEPAAIDGAPR